MHQSVTKNEIKVILEDYPTKTDMKALLEEYPTKAEMKVLLEEYPTKEDLRKVIFDALEITLTKSDKKFQEQLERIDRHIAQSALEHNKFDGRLHNLEARPI